MHHSSWTDRVIVLRSRTDRVIALRQVSVTAQCYSSILFRRQQENPSLRHEGRSIQRREEKSAPVRRGRRERALWLLFLLLFFFPPGLPYADLAQSGMLFYLKSSLRSSDLPLTFLCSIFAGFSLPCLLAPPFWTPFPYSN